ncbi:fimbrial protein [Citrobacter sp. FP75]|uniref:fimbrial protein n=1 Tax=Citrobacter sp. FP75 TaxID=1852949 RepID=UPI001BC9C23D|nr:fimbrial protein [Citrobacter sp. FP75]
MAFFYSVRRLIATLIFILIPTISIAAQKGDSVQFSFSGKLLALTPCNISNNQPVDVHFNNVAIIKIDTGQFVLPINYILNCAGANSASTVYMMFKATPSGFDQYAMDTNVTGLAVKILKDGAPMPLNQRIILSNPLAQPKLEAKLIKDPTVTLAEAPFSTSGTLIAEYL